MKQNLVFVSMYFRMCEKFLEQYLLGRIDFVHNAPAHVEKSHLVLVQSDAWPLVLVLLLPT